MASDALRQYMAKWPNLDTKDRRMVVQVEDHPCACSRFEGTIPVGQYRAGKVIICDSGSWQPVGDAAKGYRSGQLRLALHGQKLRGKCTFAKHPRALGGSGADGSADRRERP